MAAIEPLRGCSITDKDLHGVLNPWESYLKVNRDLGEDFYDCLLEAQLKGALQVVCWVKSLHRRCLSPE